MVLPIPGSGDIIGALPSLAVSTWAASALTLAEALVAGIPPQILQDLRKRDPRVMEHLLRDATCVILISHLNIRNRPAGRGERGTALRGPISIDDDLP